MTDIDYNFKIILLGDSGVGKSSTLLQFLEGRFNEEHISTVGLEYGSKILTINDINKRTASFNVNKIKMICYDMAGQDRFLTVVKSYFRQCAGVILVFDLTDRVSFEHCSDWLKRLEEVRGDDLIPILDKVNNEGLLKTKFVRRYPPVILIGNKKDKINERQISKEEAMDFVAKNYLDGYLETSAKINENSNGINSNIEPLFRELAKIILDHVKERGSGIDGIINHTSTSGLNPQWCELELNKPKSLTKCCFS